ncbi:hypothetical protein [Moritella sp. F3]|uniref:hypothetical protein n=1 Tax=Moritella sp. F3 TaxID=2718882 RepID=UPI0018E1ACE8|nr:hypothetical protein [Moritella sp. F3]GIC77137.1 hypothetical protein FMO001_18640 [Moritella sp. F1]GIC82256.1 hypothetical protein FMO003_25370 [Moritella sp. F3]
MKDNGKFCEQMAKAIIELGTEEALSCMARIICAVAQHQGKEIEFHCDIGTVSVQPIELHKH